MMMYGTVGIVSADNLASNALGGFKESCSAYRYCRQCQATHSEVKSKVLCIVHDVLLGTRRMQGIGGASLSKHALYTLRLSACDRRTMIVLMNNNHVNTIEEKELGIMWVLADIDPACL